MSVVGHFKSECFSRRTLNFTDEQVYWECREASWCEDAYRECASLPTVHQHVFDEKIIGDFWRADQETFELSYRTLVEKYSARFLTHEEDCLHAFASILRALRKTTGEPFLWGLPLTFFSSALTWPCDNLQGSAKRRTSPFPERQIDGTITRYQFPSWSWVGWVCEVYFAQCSDSLQLDATGLEFYCTDRNGGLEKILEESAPEEETDHSQRPWKGTESVITPEEIPFWLFADPRLRSAICFWSSVAPLKVDHGEVEYPNRRRIYSDDSQEFAVHWKHLPGTLSRLINTFDGIVIGDTDTWGTHKDFLNVSLVSWVDNVAYREGLISILELDWLRVSNRIWKSVVLC